jgi:hypothetical protein
MLIKNTIFLIIALLPATIFSSFAGQESDNAFTKNSLTISESEPRTKSNPKPYTTPRMVLILTDKIQETWDKRFFFNFDLRTNLLYDAMLSPTFGFECHINRNWGVKLDGSYTHWGSEHGMVHNIWFVNPELRWYIKNTDLFYIGIGGNAGRMNIYRGVAGGMFFPEDTGYQGSFFNGSISVGYKLIVNRSIAFDFNLGLGSTHFKYDSFTVIDQTRVYQRVKMKDATKILLGPTQAGVSLVWKISGHRNWR